MDTQPCPRRQSEPRRLARAEFEDEARAGARGTEPPRRHAFSDAEHLAVGREEDGVDREAHEGRVDCTSGSEQHSVPAIEPGSAHQAEEAAPVGVGQLAAQRDILDGA